MNTLDFRFVFFIVTSSMFGIVFFIFDLWEADRSRMIDIYLSQSEKLSAAKDRIKYLENHDILKDLYVCEERLRDSERIVESIYNVRADLEFCYEELRGLDYELIELRSSCGF